jgi:hypothetical protein
MGGSERARDAAREAQRQADEQLRVAMEAFNFSKLGYAGTPESGSMLLCSFPLKFNAPGTRRGILEEMLCKFE